MSFWLVIEYVVGIGWLCFMACAIGFIIWSMFNPPDYVSFIPPPLMILKGRDLSHNVVSADRAGDGPDIKQPRCLNHMLEPYAGTKLGGK